MRRALLSSSDVSVLASMAIGIRIPLRHMVPAAAVPHVGPHRKP